MRRSKGLISRRIPRGRRTVQSAVALACVALIAGCGGARPSDAAEPELALPPPSCVDARWEEPPPEIGQTPPRRPAPPDALDPFEEDGSGDGE